MNGIEMDTWTIFNHDEEGLATWVLSHRINPYPVKELNIRILDDMEQSIKCLLDIFRPSGPIRLSHAESIIKKTEMQGFYDGEFDRKFETLKFENDWKSDELRKLIIGFFDPIGGLDYNYIEQLGICGKLRIKTDLSDNKIDEYPDRISMPADSPIILTLKPVNEEGIGKKIPDSIMILVSIWTDVFMYQTNTILGRTDNTLIASINSPRLTNALIGLEQELKARIKWWGCWYPNTIEKYGFIKPKSM